MSQLRRQAHWLENLGQGKEAVTRTWTVTLFAFLGFLGLGVWLVHHYAPRGQQPGGQRVEDLGFEQIPPPHWYPPTVDLDGLGPVLTTVSASPSSHDFVVVTFLAVVLVTSSVAMALRRYTILRLFDVVALSFSAIAPTALIFALVDELPDEAYVWATKATEFAEIGVLGVPLWDGRFGESTVGTLQFALAGLLMALAPLTAEQAIMLPILTGASLLGSLAFGSLRKRGYKPLVALGLSILVSSGAGAVATASQGFDNYLGLVLLGSWLSVEYLVPAERIQPFRIALAIIAPFIRLELAVFSVALMVADLRIIQNQRISGHDFWNFFWCNSRRWMVAPLVALAWLGYKMAVFGDLAPAMATYKSPSFSQDYLVAGSTYLVSSVGDFPFLLLAAASAWLSLRLMYDRSARANLASFVSGNFTPFAVLGITGATGILAAFGGGGDYFGPGLSRYVFPYLSAILLLIFLASASFRGRGGWLRPSFSLVIVATLTFVNLQPSELYPLAIDATSVQTGRTTCDYLGTQALQEALKRGRKERPYVVATPEVNGAAFHLDAKLIDLIGLVDTKADYLFAPVGAGDNLHKYQVTLPPDAIAAADLVWLYQSAICDIGQARATEMASDPRETLATLLAGFPASYRLFQAGEFFDSGLVPLVLQFSYSSSDGPSYGVVQVLWRPPS